MIYNQLEIQAIIQEVRAIFHGKNEDPQEKLRRSTGQKSKKDDVLPLYYPTYRMSVMHAKHLSVHIDGRFPEKMFEKGAPNEKPEELNYRKENWKPITKSEISKVFSGLNSIWNPMNYSIEWQPDATKYDQDGERAQEYFEFDYPKYGSIVNYFRDIVTKWIFKDPNAVLAVTIPELPTKVDEDRDKRADTTELTEPIAIIYSSKRKIKYIEGVCCLIELPEKSIIEKDGKKVRAGTIYAFYDCDNIWRIEQVGKEEEDRFEVSVYYQHKYGFLPVQELGGLPQEMDGIMWYESFFSPSLSYLDLAADYNSTLYVSIKKHAYPERWRYLTVCPVCDGTKIDRNDPDKVCPSCKGEEPSPFRDLTIPIGGPVDDKNPVPSPPTGEVQKDTSQLEFLDKSVNDNLTKALGFLHTNHSDSHPKGSETALAKMIDREERFSFYLGITSLAYGHLTWVIDAIGHMRYNVLNSQGNPEDNFKAPAINEPKDFKIRGEAELIIEIDAARKAGDKNGLKKLLKEFYRLRFGNNSKSERIVDVIFYTDRIVDYTEENINLSLGLGRIAHYEAVLHDSILVFIEEELQVDPNFLEKELPEIKSILIEAAKQLSSEIKPAAKPNDAIRLAIRNNNGEITDTGT